MRTFVRMSENYGHALANKLSVFPYATRIQANQMHLNYISKVMPMVNIRDQIAQVVGEEGMSMFRLGQYLAFGLKIASLIRRGFAGNTLKREASIQKQIWVGRGLVPYVLDLILSQVFGIILPTE